MHTAMCRLRNRCLTKLLWPTPRCMLPILTVCNSHADTRVIRIFFSIVKLFTYSRFPLPFCNFIYIFQWEFIFPVSLFKFSLFGNLTMDLDGTGQNQGFRHMTLTTNHHGHGQKWHQNKVGPWDQEAPSWVHLTVDLDGTGYSGHPAGISGAVKMLRHVVFTCLPTVKTYPSPRLPLLLGL